MEGIECRTKTNANIEGVIKVQIWHLTDNQAWHIDKMAQIQTILNIDGADQNFQNLGRKIKISSECKCVFAI